MAEAARPARTRGVEVLEVTFPSGGSSCAGRLHLPKGSGRHPCVVLANGFSGTMDWILPDFAARFAEAGVAALAFDYRHLGRSPGEPRQLVDSRLQQEDLRNAMAFVRDHPRVDGGRIALWGTSLGGHHAATLAAADPQVKALVLMMPALDAVKGADVDAKRRKAGVSRAGAAWATVRLAAAAVRDAGRARRGLAPHYIPIYGRPGRALFTDPALAPRFERAAAGSPTWENRIAARFLLHAPRYKEGLMERIDAPILVCLAADDSEMSNDFVEAKVARAPRAKVNVYPGGHFDLYHDQVLEQVSADQAAFLATHLRTGGPGQIP